jgi:hypothetical protein
MTQRQELLHTVSQLLQLVRTLLTVWTGSLA